MWWYSPVIPALEREGNTWGLLVCQASQIILVYSRFKKKKKTLIWKYRVERSWQDGKEGKGTAAKPDNLSVNPGTLLVFTHSFFFPNYIQNTTHKTVNVFF